MESQNLTKFSGEDCLVVDCFLCEGHDIVYVLGGRHSHFLALLVEPEVRPSGGPAHVAAATHGAELRYGAVHQVNILEKIDR